MNTTFGTKQKQQCTAKLENDDEHTESNKNAVDAASTSSSDDCQPKQQETDTQLQQVTENSSTPVNGEDSADQNILEQISNDILAIVNSQSTVPFIGIAGAGASGKSYFCQEVKRILEEEHKIETLVLPMDGYHYYRHELDKMEDPDHAHARRGAEFTFDAAKFVKDIKSCVQNGSGSFPDFDHAKKDPEQDKIHFDSLKQKVVLVEGLYVLLNQEPWSELREIFSKTFFLDTADHLIVERHKHRMTTKMGLTLQEAETRIFGNDMVNAQYIKENTTMAHHKVIKIDA